MVVVASHRDREETESGDRLLGRHMEREQAREKSSFSFLDGRRGVLKKRQRVGDREQGRDAGRGSKQRSFCFFRLETGGGGA